MRVPREMPGLCSDGDGGRRRKNLFCPSDRAALAFVPPASGPFVVVLPLRLDVCLHAGGGRQFLSVPCPPPHPPADCYC